MEQLNHHIAFFDLDQTIINQNSGAVLARQAYKNGHLKFKSLISAIFQSYLYKFNLRDTTLIIKSMGSWVKGFPEYSLIELSNSIVKDFLIDAIRPEIYEEIRYHKEINNEVVMLSSAISTICTPIGVHLGMDRVICTEMEVVKGILTGKPVGNYCFGKEKGVRLNAYCIAKAHSLKDVCYYGDSISDLPALKLVGFPVCVAPDKKLARVATEKGWRICEW